jgi:Zn-dependent protease with chaperone function
VPGRLEASDLQTPLERVLGSSLRRVERWGLLALVHDALARREIWERTRFKLTTQEVQEGELHDIVQDCARILHVDPPRTYVEPRLQVNARVQGIGAPVLILQRRLVEELSPDELRFVVGHELAHIKCDHLFLRTLVEGLGELGLGRIPETLAPLVQELVRGTVGLLLLKFYRETEYSADAGGLICCQDVDVAVEALTKIGIGFDPARLEQAATDFEAQFEQVLQTRSEMMVARVLELLRSHGFAASRIQRVQAFAESERYQQILQR